MSSKADAALEISNLIYGYAEALDRGDLRSVGAFFEHCLVHVDGLPNRARGSAEVLEFFKPVLFYKGDATADQHDPESVPATKHLTTNLIIQVADDLRTATAKSYFTVIQGRRTLRCNRSSRAATTTSSSVCDGGWRFCERLEFIDLVGDLSRAPDDDDPGEVVIGSSCTHPFALRLARRPAARQRLVEIDERRRAAHARIRKRVLRLQLRALGVEHVEQVDRARVETHASERARRERCRALPARDAHPRARA
jgi:hypothetical protein